MISDLKAYAESAFMLARIRESLSGEEKARPLYEKSLVLWRRLNQRNPRTPAFKQRLAEVEKKLGGNISAESGAPRKQRGR